MTINKHIIPLNEVGIGDIQLVGGKNASLGEMLRNLSSQGVAIPNGFVITVNAYQEFIIENRLDSIIQDKIDAIDYSDLESLRRAGLEIRTLIRNASLGSTLAADIIVAYYALSKEYGQSATDVAVRSSATAEDLPDASFAGQQETYLNVHGPAALIDAIRNCFASLFTDRAISYRHTFHYDHFAIGLSVCVQKMVRSDLGASGVAFSLDTESGFKDVVVINGSFGLGEMVVQGTVCPDEFIVYKPKLENHLSPIIEKKLGIKDRMMVYDDDPEARVRIINTEKFLQDKFCLHDDQILQLAKWITAIEEYYSLLREAWCPMDVEWALDGITNQLFIVQARPETIHSRRNHSMITQFFMNSTDADPIVKGIAVGDKIGSGNVRILFSLDKGVSAGKDFQDGDVLVTDMTDPDWEPIMKKASAIVTNKGGRTCHAAIIAREMGVPAIVGCGNATKLLQTGQLVTVCCAEGDEGIVYDGIPEYSTIETDLRDLPEIKTKLMLNIGSPSLAFKFSHFPNKGVGLARLEFIINNYIGVHPLALLNHQSLHKHGLSSAIKKMTAGFGSEEEYFIEKLSYGIAKIAAAFYPQQVIVRFSDFKSNEYYNLLGGENYEPREENPMIGWRGASRYYSDDFRQAFGLECKAIKKVREQMGLDNVAVMVPFCRTVEELLKVKETMRQFGLAHGENDLKLYLMAEVPSNIILAEDFAVHIDGFSIGSNDLTQLTLGLDRDSSLVAHLYDERNKAVKKMLVRLIRVGKEMGVTVGICGQGPSDHPDFAQFLVKHEIDSISVTPDSIIKTIAAIHKTETDLNKRYLLIPAET